jgi:hypothetical protein
MALFFFDIASSIISVYDRQDDYQNTHPDNSQIESKFEEPFREHEEDGAEGNTERDQRDCQSV